MVNGLTPFKSKDLAETMGRVTNELLDWSDAIFDIAPPGFTKLVARLTAKDAQKRTATAKQALEELEKIRATASWAGRFGRKTRFDINIDWHPDTLESVRNSGIKEAEVGFVLQEIEERLIEQRDKRLVSTGPIVVDPETIKRSVDSYRNMRHRAAMTKATRVREQLGSAKPVSSGNIKALRTTPIPMPIQVKPDRSLTFRAIGKVVSTIVSILIVVGLAFYVFNRAKTRIRDIASENETLVEGMNNLITAGANPAPPVATRGSELAYSMKLTTLSGSELASKQLRKLSSVSTNEISWMVDGKTIVNTRRDLIPLETYFSPIYRSLGTVTTAKHADPIRDFKAGETFSVEIVDSASNSSEETRCTILSSRRQTLVHRIHDAWKIECLRKVLKAGQLTHRAMETYEYIPAVSSVLSVSTKLEELGPTGTSAVATQRQMDLNLELSTLQQSDPKQLSPW
jgi:hypothetical protein